MNIYIAKANYDEAICWLSFNSNRKKDKFLKKKIILSRFIFYELKYEIGEY